MNSDFKVAGKSLRVDESKLLENRYVLTNQRRHHLGPTATSQSWRSTAMLRDEALRGAARFVSAGRSPC
jgi:hypothetical protein